MAYAFSLSLVAIVWLAIVYLNERHGLLACDRFPSSTAKYIAYAWLAALLLLLAVLVTSSGLSPVTAKQLEGMPFYNLFILHAVLVVFLVGWWALSGRPGIREFLNIRHERPGEVVAIGIAAGVGGWIFTIICVLLVALALQSSGMLQEAPEPPPMIGWMAALPIWKKVLIVLSAMTVEEVFFRSFLQKRVGLIASTLLFTLAHFTYGNPILLIGVSVISLVIGVTFYRTKNVVPGMLVHGVFDAIQLFVLVPIAFRMIGAGGG